MEPGSMQQLIIVFVFLSFSAFFSAAETSLTSISKLRLRNMLEENVKGAESINEISKNSNKLLSSVLIGNNLVNIAISSMATTLVTSFLGNRALSVVIATAAATVAVLLFGELLPKTYAAQNSIKTALFVCRPLKFIIKIFAPAVFVLNLVTSFMFRLFGVAQDIPHPVITESELKTIVNAGHEAGVLEVEEQRIINNVFDFGNSQAKDIMIPRTDISAVPANISGAQALEIFEHERFTRMPVYNENMDDIIGVLHLKDFIFDVNKDLTLNISDYVREAYFTYEAKPLAELFHIMRTKRITLAVVLDEYGGTAGIITLEDLVEEIVGDIADEYDEQESDIYAINKNEYSVDPATRISDVNETLGISLESEDYESIGGYVIGLIDRIPEKNEIIESGGIRFIIEDVVKNRIEKLRIDLLDGRLD